MAEALKIGIIGLDTSHVVAFTGLLSDPNEPHHVPGGKVVAAYPGGSSDFELSHSRVEKFTTKLRDNFGVAILDSPEAVADAVDLLFICSVDGRVHREQFERTVGYGKPTYIDKPLATTAADATAIVRAAEQHGVPVMSCSSLRYADTFRAACGDKTRGDLRGVDVYGPMSLQPTQPGYFWYGVHGVDMLVSALGAGCRRVSAWTSGSHDVLTAMWDDGRVGVYHGIHDGPGNFGATLHRQEGTVAVDASHVDRPYYASLLEAIMTSLPEGRSAVPTAEMLDVVRLIEAANRSRAEDGQVVELERAGIATV